MVHENTIKLESRKIVVCQNRSKLGTESALPS